MIAWPDGSPILIGQKVSCERKKRSKGTWTRYEGKEGVVTSVELGEVRVALEDGTEASFLVEELILFPGPSAGDTGSPVGPPGTPSNVTERSRGSQVAKGAFSGRRRRSTEVIQ